MVIRTTLVAAFAFVVAAAANAAETVHLYLKTSAQGHIQGATADARHKGWIELESWSVKSPRDSASGQASGRRMHKPLTLVMHYDRSSMQLFQALCTNENVVECRMDVTDAAGKTRSATFSGVTFEKMSVTKGDNPQQLSSEVSFTYQKIEWKD